MCCVDRLNPQPKADILKRSANGQKRTFSLLMHVKAVIPEPA